MEDSLYGIEATRRFVQIRLDEISNETTICKFHHYLEKHKLTRKFFQITEQYLSDMDLIIDEGTIVDAMIISAASSEKNKERQRDPEMKQTNKGNEWYFGMKAHIDRQ